MNRRSFLRRAIAAAVAPAVVPVAAAAPTRVAGRVAVVATGPIFQTITLTLHTMEVEYVWTREMLEETTYRIGLDPPSQP